MNQETDIQSCRRLLNELAEMCDHATLTGSLEGGEKAAVRRYNSMLSHLIKEEAVPQGLFSTIPETAQYGEIGVEARMLSSYFPKDKSSKERHGDGDRNVLMRLAPFLGQAELGMLVREQIRGGAGFDINSLSNLAPFLAQDMLSELVRDIMAGTRTAPQPPSPPTPPAAPVAPAAPEPSAQSHVEAKPAYHLEPEAKDGGTLEDALNLLKSPYLSTEERLRLIDRLREATAGL